MNTNSAIRNLEIALNEALQDEYKACQTYRLVIQKLGPVRPFINILAAEQRHIQALLPLFRRYQLPIPINTWGARLTVPDTFHEACLAGVEAEIENGAMYEKLLHLSQGFADVQRVFRNLQRASQENHLRAFQRGAGLPVNPIPNQIPRPIYSPGLKGRHRRRSGQCRWGSRCSVRA
jgi:hypothetical protein